ncbi:pyridine nucleotide-disulfide oxidoreductase [Pandoraea terrae]|uniref:Pyridine nucleotide-disulfide oxidoreductase n=1 Tax=Pandoraea terrae TaxID=1537710 RepID=A0A5E4TRL0_9BURK|nr:FAD/NAD(P)-binding oxidoreductase [Pandoraea terrae]VVD89803.1 pyridine nucleotide-disulfide oxidoreductase [Pandoraea terrae]
MPLKRVLVVGGSVAGLRAVETLRQQGYDGELFLIGAEPHLPYDRPPLSKQVLTGEIDVQQLPYRDAAWFAQNQIELCLGCEAKGLDLGAKRIQAGTRWLAYDGLILATGSRPCNLPTRGRLTGIHTLRTLDDALAIKAQILPGTRVVIIGSGFIGAEVASSAAACGAQVTILEASAAPLVRAVGIRLGDALGRIHDEHGVTLVCNARVVGFGGKAHVETVRLEDGWIFPADLVVVGIGVVPNVEWLAGSGLHIANGLICDETLNVGHDDVFAAGDVVSWPNRWSGAMVRGEQWMVAADQGRHAASNLLLGRSHASSFSTIPYFWSDQYGCRIQAAGRTDIGEMVALSGDEFSRPFVALYRHVGKFVGAVAVNAPKAFAVLRQQLQQHAEVEQAIAMVRKHLPASDR